MIKSLSTALVLSFAIAACVSTTVVTPERMYALEERQDLLEEEQIITAIEQLISQPRVKAGSWYEYKYGKLIMLGWDPESELIQVGRTVHDRTYCTYYRYIWTKNQEGITFQGRSDSRKPMPGYGCPVQR